MASMLEVLREYRHLSAKLKTEGSLAPALLHRYEELEALVRAEASRRKTLDPDPRPRQDAITLSPVQPPSPAPPPGALRPAPPIGELSGWPGAGLGGRTAGAATGPIPAEGRPRPASVPPQPSTPRSPEPAVVSSPSPIMGKANLQDREKQEPWAWAAVGLLFSLGLVSSLGLGLAAEGGMLSLLRGFLLVGGVTWLVVYPALMAWRELAARRSEAHLIEPDFRAATPVVEPAAAAITALAAVVWLMFGGFANEGVTRLFGYLTGLAFWLGGLGWATALVVRPLAARYSRERAFAQYLKGAGHALEKNNPKRARRLFEMALVEAVEPEEEQAAVERLEDAYEREAEELRNKGRLEQADELLRNFHRIAAHRARGSRRRPASSRAGAARADAHAKDLLGAPSEPRVLAVGDVEIDRTGRAGDDQPEVHQRAAQYSARGRHREALELLVEARIAVPPELARSASQEYIQHGVLRSADALYDALGETQIPEFYKAVAVEWSRAEGAPPQPALRLAKILEQLNELQAAARLAYLGVLSGLGPAEARFNLAQCAVELCQKLSQDPPPEILEAVDKLVAAGDGYRRAGDEASARRCYEALAERLLNRMDQRELLIPVLNRMFKLDKYLDDRFMTPLVEDALQNQTSGPHALKLLTTYRARHREDHRVSSRLFELFAQEGQLDEALKLLREMGLVTGSNPSMVLQHFDLLRDRFPQDPRVDIGRARALIKANRVSDAANLIQGMLPRVKDREMANEALSLVDAVFEWGHPDPDLRSVTGDMLFRLGDHEAALTAFEHYVGGGGRDPEAIARAAGILVDRLAFDSGAPNHAAHLRLARFYLASGSPQDAIRFLETARASVEHRVEADLLLARAEVAASNPRRAVQVLRDAIDGRHPRDTPELHYELARVYDLLGERKKARQIDHALEEYAPEAVRRYQEERPVLEKRDTEWFPTGNGTPLEPSGDTDVNRVPYSALDAETQATEVDSSEPMTLEGALAPRYALTKRIGSGGMGDVYLAQDEMLGRPVAIKVLRRTLATDLFIAKFRDEARIVARLSHPGIVSVFDIGQKKDWSYIVMEYVRGPNLSALVNASAPPSRYDLVHYVAAVADAMQYAHEQGVIHRDLKPANILIGHDGKVKVTDFGIAHVLQTEGGDETAFSAAGLQVGTVNYMAPEQLQGRGIDGRTDIYLLGTTLYYTLSRRYPFMGDAVAVQKLRQDPTPLTRYVPDISPELDACVSQCIAREPGRRYQRMEELALVLRMVPEGQAARA